jgi:hypothetical protein
MVSNSRITRGMRIFTIIWFGQLISTLGSDLTGFALGVWIYLETGSTTLFAIRQMFASISTPVASLLAGPVSEKLFEPWMAAGGALESTLAGKVIGVGPGRGIGMTFFLSGILYIGIGMFTVFNPRIRRVEIELPDAV